METTCKTPGYLKIAMLFERFHASCGMPIVCRTLGYFQCAMIFKERQAIHSKPDYVKNAFKVRYLLREVPDESLTATEGE